MFIKIEKTRFPMLYCFIGNRVSSITSRPARHVTQSPVQLYKVIRNTGCPKKCVSDLCALLANEHFLGTPCT